MADGDDLPTSGECYAAQLDEYLIADTATFWIKALDGLGDSIVKAQDMGLALAAGAKATTDLPDAGVVVITARCSTGAASSAETAFAALATAWAPTSTDKELHLYVPGRGHVYVVGRCRSVTCVREFPAGGVFQVVATFVTTDPTVYTYVEPGP